MTDRVLNGSTKIINGNLNSDGWIGNRGDASGSHTARNKYGIYHIRTTNSSAGNYWHFKTNSRQNVTVDMMHVHAHGYAYGNSTIVDCHWGWHTDGGSGGIMNKAYLTNSSSGGVTANNIYPASDGYVVLVAYVPATYFTSFTLDSFQAEHYGIYDFGITAATFTTSNTGAY